MTLRWDRLSGLVLCLATGLFAACTPKVGNENSWTQWAQIEGALKPEASPMPREASDSRTLRVVTFNVHHGKDVDGIVKAFREDEALEEADLVSVQEIQSYPSEGASRASKIADALGMAYVYAPAKSFNSGVEEGTHGNAILSRYPLSNIEVMELPRGEIGVDVERRIAVAATVHVGDKNVRFIAVHLDTRLNPSERVLQLRPAVKDAPSPAIVAGDFNTNPLLWAFNVVPILPQGSSESDQAPILDDYMRSIDYQTPTASFGSTVSFPGLAPRLDAIFVRGLTTGSGAVERGITVSDHWPMWLDVTP